MRHIALRFSKRGTASLVGIFEDFRVQIDTIFQRRIKMINEEFEKEVTELRVNAGDSRNINESLSNSLGSITNLIELKKMNT